MQRWKHGGLERGPEIEEARNAINEHRYKTPSNMSMPVASPVRFPYRTLRVGNDH